MELISVITKSPLSAALGSLCTAWIGYRLGLANGALVRQRAVADQIADEFRGELDALIERGGDPGLVLTTDAFNRHARVIRNNLHKLSWTKRIRIQFAWRKLARQKDRRGNTYWGYALYFCAGSLDKQQKVRPLAIARVQKILSICN